MSIIAPSLKGTSIIGVSETIAATPPKKKRTQKKTAAPPAPPPLVISPHTPRPPLMPTPCPVRTHDDSLAFILETYDSLISPQITHPANANTSLIAIRRRIYSKQFNAEVLRLLHASNSPTPSVDDLTNIVNQACAICGLILM